MLSQTAVEYLSALTYREDAQRLNCTLPVAGIYWDDEIPDFRALFELSESDRNLVFRLFGIRMKIWDRAKLNESDQALWDAALIQVPSFALFRRLELSTEDRAAQDAVFRETAEGLESWFSHADEVEISGSEIGTSFSLTYDLRKGEGKSAEKPQSWRRWFRRSDGT